MLQQLRQKNRKKVMASTNPNTCKEPWPQDEKPESSKISFLKQKTTRKFLNFLENGDCSGFTHEL